MPGNEWSSASNNTSRLFEQADTFCSIVPVNDIFFCESTLLSSPIAALGDYFLVESRATSHRESDNGRKG